MACNLNGPPRIILIQGGRTRGVAKNGGTRGRNSVVAPFFVPKIGEDQTKGLCPKISGFLVQMRMGTTKQSEKSNVFTTNRWSYGFTS